MDVSVVSDKLRAHHQDNAASAEKKKGLPARHPIAEGLRQELRAELLKQLDKLSASDRVRYPIEARWLSKIADLVDCGSLETTRQSGLYLDTHSETLLVTSSPMTVGSVEAERWLWAASRVLNLLETGDYKQAYSPLSEALGTGDATEAMRAVAAVLKPLDPDV